MDWLRHRFAPEGRWDLSELILVVPAAEAGRRLLELLVEAGDDALQPPRIVTPGELPELLYEPHRPLATPLRALLTRARALQTAEAELIGQVVPHPPEPEAWDEWWSLARQMETLSQELAAGGLTVADVPRRCAEEAVDLPGEQRWEALAALEAAYRAALEQAELADRHTARARAVSEGRCGCESPVVLIAVADMPRLLGRMLEQLPGPVTSLIHAPPAHREGFDELGRLRTAYWQSQSVDLGPTRLRFADRPADQAREVVRLLRDHAQGRFAADQVTVGLGDEQQVGPVRRTLELADLPTRYAAGHPLTHTRPAMLLQALGRFLAQQRFDDLASLLRHPDVEHYLNHAMGRRQSRATIDHWLTLLDRYATEHFQGRVDGAWLGENADRKQRLRELWQHVTALLPAEPDQRQPLPAWSRPIAQALQKIYGHLELTRYSRTGEPLARALMGLAQALREQAELDPDADATPRLTASQAISLTLSRLRETALPEPGGSAAVELMGYLQLQLDDAPMLILTGMNEGAVPSSVQGDAFLPNALRSTLGLTDNARRYARDLLTLQAVVHSRPDVTLIAGRRTADGEPLAPSRLLLACDEPTLVRRITAFYDEADRDPAPALLSPGGRDRFLIPPPVLDQPPLSKLRVTAFRDYLACPYRFYLKHVCLLEGLHDQAVEMDALAFGNLAHAVLEAFGRSDTADTERAAEIRDFLDNALDGAARQRFGRSPRPAILLQIEQLRYRLHAFARQQARTAANGWRICRDGIEADHERALDLDGEPFRITGKVDRVDYHPDHGWRIIDYKTGDRPARPDRLHRRPNGRGQTVWVDLQLPLYLNLCRLADASEPVRLGYLNLPRKISEVRLELAPWSDQELREAFEQRDRVIRNIRRQKFWPPADAPDFADDFSPICADTALNRTQIIQRSRPADASADRG